MKCPITKKGKVRLEKELSDLKAELRAATREAGDAKKDVHMSKSGENELAIGMLQHKTEQINRLERLLANAEVIEPVKSGGDGRCIFGSYVDVQREDGKKMSFQIVGKCEADGEVRISSVSPLGNALLGKWAGDEAEVKVKDGVEYTVLVLAVRYEEITEPEPQPAPIPPVAVTAEDAAEKTAEPEETITEEIPAPVAPVGEAPAPSAPQEKTTFWSAALAWVKKLFK